jgi:uncharacterized protein (TIGR03437 family)
VAVTVDGAAVPVLAVEPNRLTILTSGIVPGTRVSVRVTTDTVAPFVGPMEYTANVSAYRPSAYGETIHQDWDRTVWQDDPARSGEIVHQYAIGLVPLSRLPECYYGNSIPGPQLEVLYAGAAPGYPGFWQLDLRMPVTDATSLPVLCVFEGNRDINLYLPIPYRR